MEKKRERGKNYTEQEKESLIEIVKGFHGIIENKQTDGTSVKSKNEAWELITAHYNATSHTGIRTVSQLRLLYECMKKKAKKDKANEKVEIYKTGGGSSKCGVDAVGEKMLALNADVSTREVVNVYDSDAQFDDILQSQGNNNSEPLLNGESFEDIENEGENETVPDVRVPTARIEDKNLRPGVPRLRGRKGSNNNHEEKDSLKLDILKIRKEKEGISRDILKLEKRKLQLEIKEKVLKLKKEYGDEFASD